MTLYHGEIETYTANVLSPKQYNGRRLMSLSGSYGSAFLWFYPEDATLPDNRKRAGQNMFDVYYPMSYWTAVLDLLRNESPLYFNFSDSSNAVQIYSGREPVGEEEASAA